MLIVSLLIGSIVAGFTQRLPTDKASAAITSYSTWTSTYYSYWTSARTSTQSMRTTVSTLTQTSMEGPYLKIAGKFDYWYETTSGYNQVVELTVRGDITNLLSAPVQKGKIILNVRNLEGTVTEEALAPFWELKVGETIKINQGVPLTKAFYKDKIKIEFVRAEINVSGLVTDVPIATYTLFATQTEALVRTYTSTYITTGIYEIQQPFIFGATEILAVVILVGVLVVVLAYMKLRAAGRVSPQDQQAFVQGRVCSGCGTTLEANEDFCPNCGRKWG
nr:hypothetical protein [Candidatus Njordarchaeum guaymaensis]